MPGQTRNVAYPTVEFVLDSIAQWINRYRHSQGVTDELGQCTQNDVLKIANDLGVSVADLRNVASKGPHAADTLQKILTALRVDPKALAKADPATMRDLQRVCVVCHQKGRCERELAAGTIAEHFRDFCPNAYTLEALFKQERSASVTKQA